MARSRNIKPGFFVNDVLAEIDPLGRLLFAGLWTIADREGRLEDRPKRIKAEILPYDNCDVDGLLSQLAARGFIIRYSAGGQHYISIVNWHKHQNPHIKEPASTIPAPDENCTCIVQEQCEHGSCPADSGSCPADSLNLIPDSGSLIPDSNTEVIVSSERDTSTKVSVYTGGAGGNDAPNGASAHTQNKSAKRKFAEFVSLTNDEYSSLVAELGESGAKRCIEILDNYKGANGKRYRSDYRAIKNWVINRYYEEQSKIRGAPARTDGAMAGVAMFLAGGGGSGAGDRGAPVHGVLPKLPGAV